jgi:hypothetical protein
MEVVTSRGCVPAAGARFNSKRDPAAEGSTAPFVAGRTLRRPRLDVAVKLTGHVSTYGCTVSFCLRALRRTCALMPATAVGFMNPSPSHLGNRHPCFRFDVLGLSAEGRSLCRGGRRPWSTHPARGEKASEFFRPRVTTRNWRPDRESNSGARICSPLRHHSAIRPSEGERMAIRCRCHRQPPRSPPRPR